MRAREQDDAVTTALVFGNEVEIMGMGKERDNGSGTSEQNGDWAIMG